MDTAAIRATIYFDPEIHKAIRLKAADTHRTLSDIVNEAVRAALREDQEGLAAFEDRVAEPMPIPEDQFTRRRRMRHGREASVSIGSLLLEHD